MPDDDEPLRFMTEGKPLWPDFKKVEQAGIDEVILYFNVGNKPHSMVKDQMHRFMSEIAPHFQGKHQARIKLAA